MSGSRKTMVYTADDGQLYWVELDESNGEEFGFDDYTNASIATALPKNVKMRYVNWRANDGSLSRRFPVGKPDFTLFLVGGAVTVSTIGAENAKVDIAGQITSAVGEKRKLPKAADTGLVDGDAT